MQIDTSNPACLLELAIAGAEVERAKIESAIKEMRLKLVGEHGGQFFIPKEKADSTTPRGIKPASSNATKQSLTTGSKDEPSIAPRENQRKSPVRTHVSTLIDVYAESAQYAAQKHA